MFFAPKSLFDRVLYLSGAILWPATILPMIIQEEYFAVAVLTFASTVAWKHTYRWIMDRENPPPQPEKDR